jgi:plasmid stability protein
MAYLTVRNLPPHVARALEEESRRRGKSANQTVIELLAGALGVTADPPDNGLGALAGTWTEADLAEFESQR